MRIQRLLSPLFAAVLLCAVSALAAPLSSTWTGKVQEERLQLHFQFKEHGQLGLGLPRSAFQGLNPTDGADTKFQLVREAGTVNFQGRFAAGEGAGHYQFEPNAAWLQEMAKLGYTKVSPEEQFQFALFDLGPARVKALAELGYTKIPHDELLQVAIFQVTPEHIRELAEVGLRNLDLDDLMATRIHGVTAKFVREARGLGLGELSLENLMAMRIHRVTPEYVREMREAGYPDVTFEQLVEMRIHAIDSKYVRSLSGNKKQDKK
ncbi:hypothetical protein [Archangium sp.]|uniref:hypothetical protein n=1 Tax=Archangium sp. TaxID=1872627 RepID=UPI002ED8AB21